MNKVLISVCPEGTPSWLARSTVSRTRELRTFLNRNLSAIPEDCQRGIGRRLQTNQHHRSSFFELVIACMLQAPGASIICEPRNPVDGTKIDFMATFPDGAVGVEATSPLFGKQNPALALRELLLPSSIASRALAFSRVFENPYRALESL